MRLASKIFVTSSLVVAVLLAVGILSLRAVDRLVTVNRGITEQSVPAVRSIAAARDAMLSLARLEMRFVVLRDEQYARLWDERAARTGEDLGRLRHFMRTGEETALLTEATGAFEAYRAKVNEERALIGRGDRAAAVGLAETEARQLAERVEGALDGLMEATHAAVLSSQADAARLEAHTWTRVLAALVAAVLLALVGTAWVALRLTRSLRALSSATRAVSAGSFREPIAASGGDEVGDLARAFNTMAEQLRRIDETKQEMFAAISHELRSPLTSMREAAHLLRDSVPGPLNPKQTRLVEIIGRSSDRLLRLVNQILELSRLRAGILPIERRPVDLDRVVTRALDELRPQAEEAGVTLTRERVGHDFPCLGDDDRLVQVVVNLVANAIRFTPRGGTVTVKLISAGAELEIQVDDTGIGIPAAALPHIFESYQQAHRDRGGTGLGLAIVRGIVLAHGGRVTAESQEGKGSRFTVLLPRAKAAS
jgi:two-component system sensor histidine kinase GlrK